MNGRSIDIPALVVAAGLAFLAFVLWRDASSMTSITRYGMGPDVMPMVVVAGLLVLAAGHVVVAFREGLPKPDAMDGMAVAWLFAGLLALVFAVGAGVGFVTGVALVFATTARGFAEPRDNGLAVRLMQAAIPAFVLALAGSFWSSLLGPVGTVLAGMGPLAMIAGFGALIALFAALLMRGGRRGLRDVAIGFALGVVIYLVFARLLTLSLPQGPIERLL